MSKERIIDIVLDYGNKIGTLIIFKVKDVPFDMGDIEVSYNLKSEALRYTLQGTKGRDMERDRGNMRVIYNVMEEQIENVTPNKSNLKSNRKDVTIIYIDKEVKRLESFKRKGDGWYMKTSFLKGVKKHLLANKTVDYYEISMIFDLATQEFIGFYETDIDPFPEAVKEAHVKIQNLLKIY